MCSMLRRGCDIFKLLIDVYCSCVALLCIISTMTSRVAWALIAWASISWSLWMFAVRLPIISLNSFNWRSSSRRDYFRTIILCLVDKSVSFIFSSSFLTISILPVESFEEFLSFEILISNLFVFSTISGIANHSSVFSWRLDG